ncbi:MAG: hypothetical protein IPK50_07325 [Fibrobacterota bacterium]|nr:hypothetical protein [Fibrobacterota bacterium]QQS06704.1 MAG: hypothetical protein IPK50_07325 [Fibrobacterota bacterium]
MTRSKILLAWGALLLGLSACDKTTDTPAGTAKPSNLTVSLSGTELTAGGASVDVAVAATSDTGILSIAPTFKSSSGSVVVSSFLPSFTTMPKPGDKTFASSGWKLSALTTASAGSYIMTLTLTDKSGAVTTKEVAFTVKAKGGTDPVDPVDPDPTIGEPLLRMGAVTAGAQNSSRGSFFELAGADAGTLHTSGAGLPYADIDVIFGADGTTLSFMSPDYAAKGAFSLGSWSTVNKTAIIDLGTSRPAHTGVVFDALVANPKTSATVVSGHYYGIGTVSGEIAVLYVSSVDGSGKSANAVVDVYLVEGGSVVDPDPVDPTWPKIDLGAQNAAPPSALDVDGLTAYTSGAKTASEIASIDLLLYNESTGGLRFVSPEYAYNKSFSVVSGWGKTNATFFYDNGTTPVTSLEQTQWILEGEVTEQYVNVIAGHYYIVEHSGGVVSVIKVESVTGTGSSAVVKVSIVFSDDTFAG